MCNVALWGQHNFQTCHAVGNYYLKYSWEFFMRKNMHNIFLYVISVVCWVGPTGRGYLTYSHIWGSRNTLGKNMHYIFRIFKPLQINHVCDNFHPHGTHTHTHNSFAIPPGLAEESKTLPGSSQKKRVPGGVSKQSWPNPPKKSEK